MQSFALQETSGDAGDPLSFRGWTEDFWWTVGSGRVAVADGAQALLERDVALERVDHALRSAIAANGSLLLLEGPAGIGKTQLVRSAARRGRELGRMTLNARGAELERDFAYGVVRQLLEVPLLAASPVERAELLTGAAGCAAPLFGIAGPRDDAARRAARPVVCCIARTLLVVHESRSTLAAAAMHR
jgi:hypothetical protein